MSKIICCLGVLIVFMQSASAQTVNHRVPNETWLAYAKPSEAGFSKDGLAAAKKYWESTPSAAFMVVRDGAVVVAWGDVERRYMLHSVRKSFMNGLYGIHVKANRIDLNKTLAQLGIDDVKPTLNDQEKAATVLNLLQSRSGVYHNAAAEPRGNPKPKRGRFAPGDHWCYNNWDFNTLATILEQVLDGTMFEEFQDKFAKPLGMQDFRTLDGH